MERNFPASGFGELGAGAGWTYDRKPSLMYGSSRSSHPDSELLHRQAYAPPHPLQGYSTNHHPGRQGGAWGTAGRTIGLSGLFDASLHHAGPSAPDPSVMNLISALDSRGPQSAPPTSSLLSQFRNPSWQTGMHTPAPADLFIAGTLPGSSSFPSSSALSAYQPPGSFSGRSFTPSLSLQDAPTYSPSSSSLLSPHDSLLHIKTPSQSSLAFERLLPSQSAAYRGSHEPSVPPHAQTPSSSSSCHLPSPKFNLLSPHLHNRSSQLYNTSMFASSPGLPSAPSSQPQTPPEMVISRHDSVIKHYQRSSPAQSSALQQYASYGGSSEYQQAVSHHRHAGVSCSPLGEQSPSTDSKSSPQMETQTYSPIMPTPYSSSSSGHSASSLSVTKGNKSSSSTSGYSSSGSTSSSSQNPHTPPSASSTSSSCSSSSKTSASSFSVQSCQQLPSQSAPAPPPQSGVSSTLMQQTAAKQCLSSHASQSVAKPGVGLSDSTPAQHHSQPYSPNQPPPTHMSQPYRDFSSPHSQDMGTTTGASGGKVFTGVPPGGRSFSAEIIYEDSSFGSASLKRSSSPSLGYGSESAGSGHASSVATHSSGVGSAGSGSGAASIGNESSSSYHPPDCSTSPSVTSALTHPALPSPAATECLSQSPGAAGSAKYMPSILSSAFISSPQGFQNPSQTYHSTPTKSKTETNLLTIDRSRDEEENSDFLIHHLLNTQSSTSHLSQHLSRPQQLPQSLSQSRFGEGNEMTYDLEKASDEHYHSQSVIRTGNATSSSGPETATCDTGSVSNRHLEASQMKQQTKIGLAIANSAAGGLRGAESVSHSQNHQQNELGSVVHYGRGDLYPQHSQHSHHTSHISSHSQQHTQHSQQVSQHSQHSQQSLSGSHSHSNSHMELNKPSNANDNSYLCNTPSIQQAQQNQAPHSLMDSSPNPPHPTHSSLISHNTHSKMESQQSISKQPHQQHSLNQSGMVVGSAGGVGPLGLESQSQSQSSQLQLHLQNQNVDACFSLAGQARNPTQTNQSSMSSLDMLDQSLSCANSMESGGPLDTAGTGVTIPLRKEDGGERPRQQHKLTPHHHSQQKGADIHDFLAEPDMGLSPPSHLHCLNQPSVHAQSHGPHDQQALTHHQMPHAQMTHHHSHQIAANMGTPQQTQQSQPIDHETQLSHSQVDQLKQHQFDPMTVADKVGPHQTQQQRYPPLTSICFPDSLLQDEGRSFFPEMEDIFCSSEFKSSCVGDCRAGQMGRDSLSQGRQCVKSGGTGEDYGVVGSRSDQTYGQYCHNMLGTGGGNLHLDLDSLKTHELPSTVNTEQLGLIQSQTPNIGLGPGAPGESSVSKMMGAVGGSSNTSGLTSPIFCSTRPKKLLKTSSFHLLKQRREPQPQTKKNYAQEYEFEDDEDKADVPADIRLNTRRLPDLLPDLVSSCRRGGGASGVSGLNPVMGDMDFCRASSYSSLGNPPQLLPHDGPKKRGRKPTKPKREGPPRPRGRPRIRPLPEPPYCRGLMGSVAGETRRGRGRGRGRGRRDEGLVETHRDVNKAQSLAYHHQQQQYNSQVNLQHPQPYSQHVDRQAAHQQPQHHLYQQSQGSCSHHQLHPQQHYQQQQPAPQDQNIVAPIKIKLPFTTLPPSESLLRTDSLSSSEPVLSDGSLGSAPSLGLSPGPSSTMEISRSDLDQTQSEQQQRVGEVMMEEWKKAADDPLNADDWAAVHKLATSADDFKPAFMASFLDFLKAGKKPEIPADYDGCLQENLDTCSSLKGGMRPLSSSPPSSLPSTPPQQPTGTFSDEGQGEGEELALSGCPSPCKPLDEELKGNLEALPSFSSDEEDSVSKNQDLQKSISSAISALYDTPHSLAAAMASAMIKAQPPLAPATPQEPSLSPPLPARPPIPDLEKTKEEMLPCTPPHVKEDEEEKLISPCSNRAETKEGKSQHNDEEKTTGSQEEVIQATQNLQEEEAREEAHEEAPGIQSSETPEAEDSPSAPAAPPCSPPPASPACCKRYSPLPLSPLSFSVTSSPPTKQEEEVTPVFSSSSQPSSYHPVPNAGASPPPSTSPPATLSSPLSNLPLSLPIPPPSTTPPPSSSDQDQDPEAGQPSPSSPSSSSSSSQPPSPPTPEEAPASQRLTSLHLAKKQADAAIAGESEEEDSESGGEGIFRERDEFVVRTEDIGTLKMALQTGREPPPIWRVQKALLQKFSPEIKDGQRQFCATSNYLGYFGDAKMRYQRLYVKFLENVNKKDYVRVCSRKPWHRAGLTLRRQTLAKQLPSIHAQSQQRMERQKEVKEQRDREKLQKEHREKMEQREKERKEREQLEKMTKEKEERKQREREKEAEEAEKKEKEQREQEHREVDRREEDKGQREREVNESRNGEQREREQERERKEKEVEQRETEQTEREKQQREQKEREQQEKERRGQGEKEKQKDREPMEEEEKKSEQRRDMERENRERRDGAVDLTWPKEEKREEKRVECQSRSRIPRDKAEPPPKKRKKWLKEVPSSSSDSDSSIPSDDEGPLRALVNSRAMREMFRSYVEMLVSTALDPDMIQALEDTDDELYLPPMRKIDSLLSEQKKRLLGRVNMSAQHQEALHLFPKMTADPLESGAVRVHLGGEGYNRKTLNRVKKSISKQQDMKLSIETCRIYSLYHSLHHYKYHTFLHCKKETDSIEQAAEDPGQEEVVQQCMANQSWLESLFNSFVELLSLSCKA
ncbi:Proline-rich protein 12 [Oryzias melastigma]|uniref:Proline-rich protein 12 n=1 Tax=Oryzias melastigma TaxID=30732 RepID=A0A834F3I1_ORYME|nr:Proline-rich protein 12 [Oryzias melastigma]